MQIETNRLILREMSPADFDALYAILSDAETMQHYPTPFDAEKVHGWIARNMERYRTDGFGLWAAKIALYVCAVMTVWSGVDYIARNFSLIKDY